mmetsp:Transcript_25393/g.70031  ORF Transcript_25393/g.70031 Transcript_25393/m.70031 type:complete len:264 (+) Transcript_25393:974-1765(+)
MSTPSIHRVVRVMGPSMTERSVARELPGSVKVVVLESTFNAFAHKGSMVGHSIHINEPLPPMQCLLRRVQGSTAAPSTPTGGRGVRHGTISCTNRRFGGNCCCSRFFGNRLLFLFTLRGPSFARCRLASFFLRCGRGRIARSLRRGSRGSRFSLSTHSFFRFRCSRYRSCSRRFRSRRLRGRGRGRGYCSRLSRLTCFFFAPSKLNSGPFCAGVRADKSRRGTRASKPAPSPAQKTACADCRDDRRLKHLSGALALFAPLLEP